MFVCFDILTETIVFRWYLQHSLPVTPLNPRENTIAVAEGSKSEDYTTKASPSAVPSPSTTSLSIITPPPITKELLKEAKEAGIHAVWLQPGTYDDEILQFARTNWPDAALGGEDTGNGRCILVSGEEGLALADKQWSPAWPARL